MEGASALGLGPVETMVSGRLGPLPLMVVYNCCIDYRGAAARTVLDR